MFNSNNNDSFEKEAQTRVVLMALLTAIVFSTILLRAGYIQIVKNTNFSERSQRNREVINRIPPIRGRIFSSDNQVLAHNKKIFNILIDSRGLSKSPMERQKALLKLSEIIKIDYHDIEKMISASKNTSELIMIAENIPFIKYTRVLEVINQLEGIEPEEVLVRDYPNFQSTSHVIGYIGPINFNEFSKFQNLGYRKQDWIGKIGVENGYENILRGKEGYVAYEIDAKMNISRNDYVRKQDPEPGDDLVLTIDLNFQQNVENILTDRTGSIVVMRPSTGEILAMVSYPNFDPNIYILQNPENYAKRIEMSLDTKGTPLINRAIQSEYPPGSTFKMISSFIIVEENVVPLHKQYFCNKSYRMNNQTFGCWANHGNKDFYGALADSCDVYFYNTSLKFGIEKITEYAGAFGLGQETGVDIPFERTGFIPSVARLREKGETWYLGNTLITSIGQGDVSTTVLQLANYISTIVNDGVGYKPHLVKSIIDPQTQNIKKEIVPEVHHRAPLSITSFREVKRAMSLVVSNGTATRAFYNLKRPVSGKTGTSEVGVGQKKQTHSLFVGFGPTDRPVEEQIAVAVMLEYENGNPFKYAGNIAAMVFSSWIFNEDYPSAARRIGYPVRSTYNE